MHHHPLTESAQHARAAKHLIQVHGKRAAAVAAKRETNLQACGELGGADTWRKIGEFVRAIEARDTKAPTWKATIVTPAANGSTRDSIPDASPADVMPAGELHAFGFVSSVVAVEVASA